MRLPGEHVAQDAGHGLRERDVRLVWCLLGKVPAPKRIHELLIKPDVQHPLVLGCRGLFAFW